MSDTSEDKVLPADLMTTGEVARSCGVTNRTVERWIADGKLSPIPTPGKHYRLSVQDVRRASRSDKHDKDDKRDSE